MSIKLFTSLFRRQKPPVAKQDETKENSNTTTPVITSSYPLSITPVVFTAPDITEEKNFSLLTGIKEDEFIVQVLAAKENQSRKTEDPVIDENEPAPGNITGEPLFESFELVKRLRSLEKDLTGKQAILEKKYTFEYYQQVLKNIRYHWGEDFTSLTQKEDTPPENTNTKEGTGNTAPTDKPDKTIDQPVPKHTYYPILQQQLGSGTLQLKEFFQGISQNGNEQASENNKIQGTGALTQNKTDYDKRRDIKHGLLDELKQEISDYNTKTASRIYKEYNEASSVFFWKTILLLSLLTLTFFFIWHLLSPYTWEFLPVAILLDFLLILVPAAGFKYLFKLNKDEIQPALNTGTKKRNGWLISLDILLPLVIVLIIVLVNWNKIAGYTLPFITIAGAFLLLLATRAGSALLFHGYRKDFRTAIEKLYAKRAFNKYARQHRKNMEIAKLTGFSPMSETDEYKTRFFTNQKEMREKFEEIVNKDRELNRQFFLKKLEEHYKDDQDNFNAWFNMTELSPYLHEIRDLGTVRRLLARLQYLYNLAIGS